MLRRLAMSPPLSLVLHVRRVVIIDPVSRWKLRMSATSEASEAL